MAIRHFRIVGDPTSAAVPLRLARTYGEATTLFSLLR